MYLALQDLLPDDVIASYKYDVPRHFSVLQRGGTENHAFMHRTSGYLFAEAMPYAARPDVREDLKEWLREQVKKFYTVGQGEYDSSSYLAFTAASWANVYDFAEDENMRTLAKAALDWLATGYALKYFHGVTLGPESRGFAREAVGTVAEDPSFPGTDALRFSESGSNSDWVGWLWWGDSDRGVWMDRTNAAVDRYAIIPALSSYEPHPLIKEIAQKRVPLPFEARGSKPSYYGTDDNKDQEYLYFEEDYAMGTLYTGEDGILTEGTILPQTTMFKLLARTGDDVLAFGASSGYHRHFLLEGRTPFDQYHQKRGAMINVMYAGSMDEVRRRNAGNKSPNLYAQSIFGFPAAAGDPIARDGWYFWKVGEAYVAARPLNGEAIEENLSGLEGADDDYRWLVSTGELGGWVVQGGQAPEYPTLESFQEALFEQERLELDRFESDRRVTYTSLAGDVLEIQHTGGPGGRPEAWTNGEKLDFGAWPVFESPYVRQDLRSGVLTVTDGNESLEIDFTGEWPRYTGDVPRGGATGGATGDASESRAYPNPSTGTATVPVQVDTPATLRIILYDMLGREVASRSGGTVSAGENQLVALDLDAMPSGVYAFRITTQEDGTLLGHGRIVHVR